MPPNELPRPKFRFRGWKRTLLMVLLLLTGGAILNVAVAWSCALVVAVEESQEDSESAERCFSETWYGGPFSSRFETAVEHGAVSWTGRGWGRAVAFSVFEFGGDSTTSDSLNENPSLTWVDEVFHGQVASGWPCLSCAGEVWKAARIEHRPRLDLAGQIVFEASIRAPWQPRDSFDFLFYDAPLVPLRPLWPGFAINTIFYAAILWLLWIAPGRVRRFVRVRRGRCPACGFIIAPGTCANGLCSECGAALPWRTADAAQQQKT